MSVDLLQQTDTNETLEIQTKTQKCGIMNLSSKPRLPKTKASNPQSTSEGINNVSKTNEGDKCDSDQDNSSRRQSSHGGFLDEGDPFDKLLEEISYIKDSMDTHKKLEDAFDHFVSTLEHELDSKKSKIQDPKTKEAESEILELRRKVMKLKMMVPPTHSSSSSAKNRRDSQRNGFINSAATGKLLDLDKSVLFEDYNDLEARVKICLLCFALFPENAMVKKKLLTYWWIGEGLIDSTDKATAEDEAERILRELVGKGLIKPVDKLCGMAMDSFKMEPLVRSVVIRIAKEVKFFGFDGNGNPTAKELSCCKACLVEGEGKEVLSDEILGTLQAWFNYNKRFPDDNLELSKMKNLNVLYLGRSWQSSQAKHHIEVDNTMFLNGLKYPKYLRLLSLQGIFQITELPKYLCRLANLRVLDLRACHNLELLPAGIGSLKRLTHLDMSECYLVEYIPKGLSSLTELRVLKGFIINDRKKGSSCTLEDLKDTRKLWKLSIHTSIKSFPREAEVNALRKFGSLKKLKIAWGGQLTEKEGNKNNQESGAIIASTTVDTNAQIDGGEQKHDNAAAEQTPAAIESPGFLENLEKLDMECFPRVKPPSWLMGGKLKKLEKLYIRGGELKYLQETQKEDYKWKSVKILRLKYLNNFKLTWEELEATFPNLKLLEKVKCPKLALYPCDESGSMDEGMSY